MSWKLKEHEQSMYKIIEVIDENGEVIKTFVADELSYSEKKKKAQLMAAAPKLLRALEELLDCLYDFEEEFKKINSIYYRHIEEAHRVINKAKGAD